jgi:hypothetical protein
MMGSKPRINAVVYFAATIVALLVLNAVGTLIYGALGQSLDSTAGKFSLVLCGVMGVTVIAGAIAEYNRDRPAMFKLARLMANAAAGAVVGFYYGGTTLPLPTAQQIPWAIAGAILGALLGAGLSGLSRRVIQVSLACLRTIVIYGFAFLNGAMGMMGLSQGQWWGLGLLGLAIWSLGVTWRSIFTLAIQLENPQ